MNEIEKLMKLRAEKLAQMEQLTAEDMSDEQAEQVKALDDEIGGIDAKIGILQKVQARKKEQEKLAAEAARLADAPVLDRRVIDAVGTQADIAAAVIKIPASAKRWSGNLTAFKGPDAETRAYKAGMFFRAINGNTAARQWCAEHGIGLQWEALHQEGNNTEGGYLVYDELDTDIIKLVEQYGVFRRLARRSPMTSDTKSRNRRTGGLTAHFVGEGVAGTVSTGSWDRVNLIAKKIMVLTKVTNELQSDAIISMADELVEEIARAFAQKEDACGFLGDGTSTYGGIVGVLPSLTAVAWSAPSVSTGAGLVEWGTGTGFENITLANLVSLLSLLPQYARLGAAWHCSGTFFDAVITRLVTAAGGNVANTIIDGVPVQKVLGYPVELNETMNILGVDQKISCLFGNLKQAADFGDRQGMTIAFSEHATVDSVSVFETDELAVRGTERFDINVHDVGTSSTRGPIVGLMCYDAA